MRYEVCMAMLLGTLISGAVPARQVTQPLSVSAKVLPSAAFSFELGAQSLVISEQDMKRGYVDVTMKSHMRYARHSPRGEARPSVTLDISGRPELFKSVAEAPGATPAEFRYRFLLSDAGRAGTYAAPVSLIVEL